MDKPISAGTGQTLSSDFFYGWDLLYKTVESQIEKKSDVIIVLAHFLLTKHCKFRCIGIGSGFHKDNNIAEQERGSELLPEQWNVHGDKYSMRYMFNKVQYLLLANITEDALIVNLLNVSNKNISNICIIPESTVKELKGSITTTIPNALHLVDRFRRELCDPVFESEPREMTAMAAQPTNPISQSPAQTTNSLLIEEHRPRPLAAYLPQHPFDPTALTYPDVGRSDLDPLANTNGNVGNLYTFPRNTDPLRPNVPGQNGPTPDHAQPPDWNPDQYM